MKVAIVGAGPSGLYLGLLLKSRAPDWDVRVVEQNPPDATFGFGVVIAETGLAQLHDAHTPSHDAMSARMHHTHGQTIVHRETPIEVKRSTAGGAIGRLALLSVLQGQCADVGVPVRFGQRLQSLDDLAEQGLAEADVVVGADGINSLVRRSFPESFGTTQRTLTNHFAWYGTGRVFRQTELVFRSFEGGHYVAHYYPYSDTMSTFVAECDDATWQRCGLDRMSDDERQRLFERIYAPELGGMPLVANNSIWRQFPVIRNARWSHGRHVLIGDALASAHFSIGSGTRIAMNDAIALADALLGCGGDVRAGLEAYQRLHEPQKTKLIAASERSFDWYERMSEWMERYDPEEFVYAFMTRTGRIDDTRLREQFPELMARIGSRRPPALAGA